MKIVILTNNNSQFGKKLVQQLEENGITLEGIVILNQPLSYHIKLFRYVKRSVGFLEAIIFSVLIILKGFITKNEKISYEGFTSRLHFSNGTNTRETESLLKKLNPDIIILGQTGIIRKNIIATANIGVLNAHPGILPDYRGIDCLKWAVFNKEFSKIGCSIHWVNAGVDTGPIICTSQYKIDSTLSLDKMEWNLYLKCVDELVGTLKNFQSNELIKGKNQTREDGKQFRKMSLSKEVQTRIILRKIRNGVY